MKEKECFAGSVKGKTKSVNIRWEPKDKMTIVSSVAIVAVTNMQKKRTIQGNKRRIIENMEF